MTLPKPPIVKTRVATLEASIQDMLAIDAVNYLLGYLKNLERLDPISVEEILSELEDRHNLTRLERAYMRFFLTAPDSKASLADLKQVHSIYGTVTGTGTTVHNTMSRLRKRLRNSGIEVIKLHRGPHSYQLKGELK